MCPRRAGLVFLCLATFIRGYAVSASDLPLLAAPIPPFITEQGTGPAVRLVASLARRVGREPSIAVMPLARALEIAHSAPAGVFLIGRSAERDQFLEWGPVLVEEEVALMVKADGGPPIASTDDAKPLSIGTLQHSITEATLHRLGFGNIVTVPSNTLAARMLAAGRFDVWCVPLNAGREAMREEGMAPGEFRKALVLSTLPLYLAFSKEVPEEEVERWNAAFAAMKADGTYRDLMTD